MPRASQMPRTRALLTLHTTIRVAALTVVVIGAAAARSAGEQWWIALLAFLAIAAGVIAGAGGLAKRLRDPLARAAAKDYAALPDDERALPYGVSETGGTMLLPTKLSMQILAVVLTAIVLVVAVIALMSADPVGVVVGVALGVLAAWMVVVCTRIIGTRIRLTPEGIESAMPIPTQRYGWIEVPDLQTRGNVVVLKAAGRSRPRVWIRCGLLEVATDDCVGLIRRRRGW